MLSGMHVICIPYALMKQNPVQWLNVITKYKGRNIILKLISTFDKLLFFSLEFGLFIVYLIFVLKKLKLKNILC